MPEPIEIDWGFGPDRDEAPASSLRDEPAPLELTHPPRLPLLTAAALVAVSAVLIPSGSWTLAGLGYGAAVAATLAAGLFRFYTEQRRASERGFVPSRRADTSGLTVLLVALALAAVHALVVATELARRWAVPGLGLVVVTAGLVAGPLTSPAAAQADQAASDLTVDAALSSFRSCLATGRPGQVAILVDESGSLAFTDPGDHRVEAVREAVQFIDFLGRSTDGAGPIEVLLAGFAVGYEVQLEWTGLDDGSEQLVIERAERFASRDDGLDTDYYLALQGVADDLAEGAERAVRSGDRPCQLLVWITDGEYSIEDRTPGTAATAGGAKPYAPEVDLTDPGAGRRLTEIGQDLLCEPDGVVDDLRAEDVGIIAVALQGGSTAEQDYGLMQAVVTADPSGPVCGRLDPAPSAVVPTDQFRGLEPGTRLAAPYSFEVDHLTAAVALDAIGTGADPTLSDVVITAPSGEELVIGSHNGAEPAADSRRLGPHLASWNWYSESWLSLEVDLDQGAAAGIWQLAVRSAEEPEVSLATIPGVGVTLDGPDAVRAGTTTPVVVALTGRNGEELAPEAVTALDVEAVLVGADGDLDLSLDLEPVVGRAAFGSEVAVPDGTTESGATLEVAVTPIDRASGLLPLTASFQLRVDPPIGYPTIDVPDPVTQEGLGAAPVVLQLTGDAVTDGCVAIEDVVIERAPASLTMDDVTPPSPPGGCVPVAAGGSGQIVVSVPFTEEGRGTVTGRIVVVSTSDNATEPLQRTVPFEIRVTRPVDTPTQLVLAVSLTAAGMVVPFLILLGLRWLGSRFRHGSSTWWLATPVDVTPTDLTAGDGSFSESFRAASESRAGRYLDEDEGAVEVSGLRIRRRFGASPFAVPRAEVSCDGATLVIGSHGQGMAGNRVEHRIGRVAFGLRGQWVVLIDEVRPVERGRSPESARDLVGSGRLVAFVATSQDFDQVVAAACSTVPAVFERQALAAWQVDGRPVGGGWPAETGPGPGPSPDGEIEAPIGPAPPGDADWWRFDDPS